MVMTHAAPSYSPGRRPSWSAPSSGHPALPEPRVRAELARSTAWRPHRWELVARDECRTPCPPWCRRRLRQSVELGDACSSRATIETPRSVQGALVCGRRAAAAVLGGSADQPERPGTGLPRRRLPPARPTGGSPSSVRTYAFPGLLPLARATTPMQVRPGRLRRGWDLQRPSTPRSSREHVRIPSCSSNTSVYTAGKRTAPRAPRRRHPRRRRRPRRQDHVARAGPARRLPDRPARRAVDVVAYVRALEAAMTACAELGLDDRAGRRSLRGVGPGRERGPDRKVARSACGSRGRDDARLRAQLQPRPRRVRPHRAVRHRRRRRDLAARGARSRGHRRARCGPGGASRRSLADVRWTRPAATRVPHPRGTRDAPTAAGCCASRRATPRCRSSASPSGSGPRRRPGPSTPRSQTLVKAEGLHTVCQEAGCPNIYECWEDREATFLIGGDQCTRRCDFCQIDTGKPAAARPRRAAPGRRVRPRRWACGTPRSPASPATTCPTTARGCTPRPSARSTR